MRVRLDTSIAGATRFLRALAEANYLAAIADPVVRAELIKRCTAQPGKGFTYVTDDKSRAMRGLDFDDEWSDFKSLIEGHAEIIEQHGGQPSDPLESDCEDQAAAYAAAGLILQPHRKWELAITQPKPPSGLAHAHLWIDDRPFDPCTINGMDKPPPSFYGSGESARARLLP